MAKVMFFIDGFNVYHSIKANQKNNKLLWLDYSALAEQFTRKGDILSTVHYFTAYATWKPHSMRRHKKFVDAFREQSEKDE